MKNQDLTKADLLEKLSKYERRIKEIEAIKEESERSENALQLAYSELNQIFQTAADGMWVIDKEFNVLRMNAALCELSGVNLDEGIGKKCYEVFHGALCQTSECPLSRIIAGKERIECEVEKQDRSGSKIPCIIAATPWRNSNGQLLGIVENYKDISKWKEIEKKLLTYQDELEHLVEDRVVDIEETNKRLIREIDEKEKIEKLLRQSEQELTLLSTQLLHAQEEERKFIAYNLHDGLGQKLTALIMFVESIIAESPSRKNIFEKLAQGISMLQDAHNEVGIISSDLRPPIIDDLGLATTVGWFCRRFEESSPWIFVTHAIDLPKADIPDEIEIAIFRVLQEAMNNVAKHSQCDQVHVRLSKTGRLIELVVKDNGVGFEMPLVLTVDKDYKGFGLLTMKERARLLGGACSIESTVGAGTVVSASWPYRQA